MEPFSHLDTLFSSCQSSEDFYKKIIELGQNLPPFPQEWKKSEYLVAGCQSIVYLRAELNEGTLSFQVFSDALISAGLAALLAYAYEGRSPEFLLKNKPLFLESLKIQASLSPGRSNGVAGMYLAMQKWALKFLVPIS